MRKTKRDRTGSINDWLLSEELTVVQAALLIVGVDPSHHGVGSYVEGWEPHKRPEGYEAAKHAVAFALLRGQIDGSVVLVPDEQLDSEESREADTVDVVRATVGVGSLREWLANRGVTSGFFFPEGGSTPDFLDPSNPRYAPKLAAAVRAWEATGDPRLLSGTTPKQACKKWLREHAAEFGLCDQYGRPNETGIDEVAKVINWQPLGGAPRTPE